MRTLLLTLLLCLAAPLAAQEETPQTVDEAIARVDQIFKSPATDTPETEVYTMLGDALRQARREGRLTGDWAIIYAMLTDGARNVLRNPSYALQLADEGLALVAGDPAQWDYRAVLRVTRAYALADLGRLDAAVRTARLALPDYRKLWDDELADELVADAAEWEKGALTAFNTPATELARDALDRAEAALDSGAWARAITLASTGLLSDETGFSALERGRINARAEYLAARGLAALSRFPEAGNALLRALEHMTAGAWRPGTPARFLAGDPLPEADAALLRRILLWLANVAMRLDRAELAAAVLDEAERHIVAVEDRTTLLTLRASLLWRGDDPEAAMEVLERTRRAALDAGDRASAAMAGLYGAVARASLARRAGDSPDPSDISQATETAIRNLPIGQHGFVWLEAARALRGTDQHGMRLDHARNALKAAQDELAQGDDSEFGRNAARASVRGTVEEVLNAAHAKLSHSPGPYIVDCAAASEIYGCMIRSQANR